MADGTGETSDWVAITRLQRAYADAVDRRDWDAVRALFLPDAVVSLDLVTRPSRELSGPEALTTFIAGALERYSFFQFVILNSHIEIGTGGDPDVATARVFFTEMRLPVDATERDDAFGLYRDTYRRTPDGWRFAHRRYRSIAQFPAATVHPLDEG